MDNKSDYKDKIYQEEGQFLIMKLESNLMLSADDVRRLYNVCSTDISKKQIEIVDKLLNEARRILSTWDVSQDN